MRRRVKSPGASNVEPAVQGARLRAIALAFATVVASAPGSAAVTETRDAPAAKLEARVNSVRFAEIRRDVELPVSGGADRTFQYPWNNWNNWNNWANNWNNWRNNWPNWGNWNNY